MKIFIIITLLVSTLVHSRKKELPYGVIFSKSDLIIDGKIKHLENDFYTFEIDYYLKGKSNKTINVIRWKDWSCDKHIKDLEKNQRLLLFLKKNNDNKYEIINNSKGELYVDENNSVKTFSKNNLPNIYKFKQTIVDFLKILNYNGKLYPLEKEEKYFKKLVHQHYIDEKTKKNLFLKEIIREIKRFEYRIN